MARRDFYPIVLKPASDRVAAALLLSALAPLMLVVAGLVRLRLGRPVLFAQDRPGRHARTFRLMKFRTMTDATDREGRTLSDAERMTPFGQVLRRLSLDELPQLFNVLRGDMSLIGPRPLLTTYLPRYSPRQARRHEVLPGLTGWAQVNGRNALSWGDRLELDVWYVDHLSLGVDLRIAWMTLGHLMRPRDVAHSGHATMPEFDGEAETRTHQPAGAGERGA